MADSKISKIAKKILSQAKKKRVRVGIGILYPDSEIVASLKKANKIAKVVLYGRKIPSFECYEAENEKAVAAKMIQDAKMEKLDAVARGQLDPCVTWNYVYKYFKEKELTEESMFVPAVLSNKDKVIFIGCTSLGQGFTFLQKKSETINIIKYIQDLGIKPKIAIMALKRPVDPKLLRGIKRTVDKKYPLIEKNFAQANKLVDFLKNQGLEVKNYGIDYEMAIRDRCNFILPSLGPVGNVFIKTLIFFGRWKLLASPLLNFQKIIFEEGAKAEKDFFWHIIHSAARVNSKR